MHLRTAFPQICRVKTAYLRCVVRLRKIMRNKEQAVSGHQPHGK
nr:MAG TPA: hypothetical protein [Caudoviricetes sp.]